MWSKSDFGNILFLSVMLESDANIGGGIYSSECPLRAKERRRGIYSSCHYFNLRAPEIVLIADEGNTHFDPKSNHIFFLRVLSSSVSLFVLFSGVKWWSKCVPKSELILSKSSLRQKCITGNKSVSTELFSRVLRIELVSNRRERERDEFCSVSDTNERGECGPCIDWLFRPSPFLSEPFRTVQNRSELSSEP